jgi:plasmid stabilization system protein ParE
MAKAVKWTEMAWDDLANVADYIAKDSRYYAAAFVREVREAVRSLRRFPERGTIVGEVGDPNIREIYVRQYRLIYQVAKTVSILAFVHGARNLEALWKRQRHSRKPPNN